ncbi:uncharacterized protein SCODWIG_02629 [Saccharomycodes ludwigii]|uniref:Protein-lysine N-methyltransferase EFM3 n=1 Tax=Saccharomycodes ludwigii TaxID=36035 RepID=A0A376B879_9ASCO|nr:hypothetical protein SCDLUD_004360 [Saccharomycodes ludwigii]KAH3900043.1 hypothetical protein SCDLUD_004360 [Saccharomycodes ludwigii]SSD60868.1 uncharacterized protein SCODWIG_02629 [Saccharomycodes ludwigii]
MNLFEVDIINKFNQRYPFQNFIKYCCGADRNTTEKLRLTTFINEVYSNNDNTNKYYIKQIMNEMLKYLDTFINTTSNTNDSRVCFLDEPESFQEWLYEQYIEYLNIQYDPNLEDIITYTFSVGNNINSTGLQIKIREKPNIISSENTTGLKTWEAALYLTYYLCKSFPNDNNIKTSNNETMNVLELGCGTGVVGISYYKLYAKYWANCNAHLTDGSDFVINEVLPYNCKLNDCTNENVHHYQMDWSEPYLRYIYDDKKIDLILGADITFDDECIYYLTYCLKELFHNNAKNGCYALISATIRKETTIEYFIQRCKELGLQVELVSSCSNDDNDGFIKDVLFKPLTAPIRIYKVSYYI